MARAKVVSEHGYEILKDSKSLIEATARIDQHAKYVFLGRLTFEKVWSGKYGWQVIICVWMPEGYPKLEERNYPISRGRIEICVPEVVARRMKLFK